MACEMRKKETAHDNPESGLIELNSSKIQNLGQLGGFP